MDSLIFMTILKSKRLPTKQFQNHKAIQIVFIASQVVIRQTIAHILGMASFILAISSQTFTISTPLLTKTCQSPHQIPLIFTRQKIIMRFCNSQPNLFPFVVSAIQPNGKALGNGKLPKRTFRSIWSFKARFWIMDCFISLRFTFRKEKLVCVLARIPVSPPLEASRSYPAIPKLYVV